jgi:hypothetical protein
MYQSELETVEPPAVTTDHPLGDLTIGYLDPWHRRNASPRAQPRGADGERGDFVSRSWESLASTHHVGIARDKEPVSSASDPWIEYLLESTNMPALINAGQHLAQARSFPVRGHESNRCSAPAPSTR